MQSCTTEYFPEHDLTILQPENGYRYAMDALLLSRHAEPFPGEKILDIGTGCGIIPLMLCRKAPDLKITGIEIQTELATIARQNVKKNHLENIISVIHQDILKTSLADISGGFDRIISNPPFIKKNCGRINPNYQKALARHEITLDLNALVTVASKLLADGGVIEIIYPTERTKESLSTMIQKGITPSSMRFIHTRKSNQPKRVIISGIKNKPSNLKMLPPFFPSPLPYTGKSS